MFFLVKTEPVGLPGLITTIAFGIQCSLDLVKAEFNSSIFNDHWLAKFKSGERNEKMRFEKD